MEIFAPEQLGPTQSLTPEGYLLCESTPIGRTGSQVYAAHEFPDLVPGLDGMIRVTRDECEVFRPETIASFEGKSITVNHVFVNPTNVQRVEVGHAQNVRRSQTEPDLLVADILIKDEAAIKLVRDDRDPFRELSCGYDAEYVQEMPGVACQRNIVGNHVALVKRGRAGPRCSIQDEETQSMTTPKHATLMQRLLASIKSGDVALMKRTADEAEDETEAERKKAEDEAAELEKKETADSIAKLTATVDALTGLVATLVKTKDEDETPEEKKETEDEETAEEKGAAEAEAGKQTADTASRAEILAPGFVVATADARDVVQRKVLAEAMKTADGKATIVPLLAGRTVDALPADVVATVFVAASEIARNANNSRGARHAQARTKDFGAVVTAAEINRRNAEFYSNKN